MSWYKNASDSKGVDPNELSMGIDIEKEHLNIYNELKDIMGDDLPWTEDEFAEKIARAHLKELKDYYSRLKKIENR